MRQRINHLSALILLAVALISLASCRKDKDTTSDTPDDTTTFGGHGGGTWEWQYLWNRNWKLVMSYDQNRINGELLPTDTVFYTDFITYTFMDSNKCKYVKNGVIDTIYYSFQLSSGMYLQDSFYSVGFFGSYDTLVLSTYSIIDSFWKERYRLLTTNY